MQSPMDPFAILGILPRYTVDLVETEKRYRDLSRTLHPDKFVGRPAGERRMALSRAIEVNEAWRTLKDPVKRAEALMRRAGVEIGESRESSAAPELLMEMMERREALSEAREAKDRAELERLVTDMRQREQSVIGRLAECLDSPDCTLENARSRVPVLGELRYIRRFLEEASAAEDELTT